VNKDDANEYDFLIAKKSWRQGNVSF